MADISTELARILSAIYGEDVRGSIHDAIEKINDVSEVVLTTGTDVTSPSSSSTGYYKDSLYVNTDTNDLWKCTGTDTWALIGNLEGAQGETGNGIESIELTSTSGLVDTYTITYTDGSTSTFTIHNGAVPTITINATADALSSDTPTVTVTRTGTTDAPIFSMAFSGLKGQQGVQGIQGETGETGNGIASIAKTSTSGKVDTYTITMTDGSTATFTVTNGEDGHGAGDMLQSAYDPDLDVYNAGGIVDYVSAHAALYSAGANINISSGHVISVTGLATVATSGSYNDLSNKPTIPTVDQTYSATSSNAQSGKAVASAISSIHGGGMQPYLYIDSEAGATVTVNQPDGTTITPTAAGSGHWECKLTGGYGTYVIHSVLSGQGDATQSLTVDTVKEYHVTDTHYDHTISFVAPSGSTVRIVGGTETYTLTGTGSTQTQAVHSASTSFTVTATMDGNGKPYTFTTPSTTGQTTTIPSGTFDFGTINVSVAADFVTAGSMITCVNGGTSCTPKTAASTLTFRVPTTGTWTISGEISGQTYSVDAVVTSLSTAVSVNLQTLPEGSTVTPTDDIQIWLNCAGIYNKTSYTTLADVLGDSTTLLALMSDNNAVDYLVRSTTWATDICADSTAMTDIGANNYAADTLLADEDWLDAIANSTYFESVLNAKVPVMTSNTTPSGEVIYNQLSQGSASSQYEMFNGTTSGSSNAYITAVNNSYDDPWGGYDFGSGRAVKPKKILFITDYTTGEYAPTKITVKGSNDKITFTDLTELTPSSSGTTESCGTLYNSNIAYRYVVVQPVNSKSAAPSYVRVIEMQFYCREDV